MPDVQKAANDTNVPPVFAGSCACGRVTFHCHQRPATVTACHCVTCRKLSGGPYQAFADVDAASVTLFDNTEHLRHEGWPTARVASSSIVARRFSAVGERAFCASCGSPLSMRYRHAVDQLGLNLGLLDEDSIRDEEARASLSLRTHIFVGQKAGWVDGVAKGDQTFERFTPGFEAKLEVWQREGAGRGA